MTERDTVHPAAARRALAAVAEGWARETGLAGWIERLAPDARVRETLGKIAKQCFGEGFYRGALAVRNGERLAASLDQGSGESWLLRMGEEIADPEQWGVSRIRCRSRCSRRCSGR